MTVFTVTGDESSSRALSRLYNGIRWSKHSRARWREAPPAHEIAETIARSDPGPAANPKVVIADMPTPGVKIPPGVRFLLSRAFRDCKEVIAEPLAGGRAARVYRIHALFERSAVGTHPLPFFAKAHFCKAIGDELDRYREFVAGFVPPHLHPRIDERRCVQGATESLLVGGFVESSESLMDAVARGMGEGPIHGLCAHSLRGWHNQAFAREPIRKRLMDSLDWHELPFCPDLLATARALGLRNEADRLVGLVRSLPEVTHRVGPIHGDLHARNVQVRNGESILIDFRSTRSGPIAADLAALETSIAFDRFPHGSEQAAWAAIVKKLYAPENIDRPPGPLLSHCPEAWLWAAVRNIRQHASFLVTEKHEYRELVALYLLSKACHKPEQDRAGDEHRRSYAVVLGESLIQSLQAAD